jgi:hypothetical protein
MKALKYIAATLVTGLALCSSLTAQQPPHCAQILFCLVNQEATASDPAGIHKYSEDVIEAIVPLEVGKTGFGSFTDRLAQAEQKARAGQGKLVPEANVVRAFNELMAKIGALPSMKADEASMHSFSEYAAAIKAFPALFSADRNGTNCNPGEAVFLLSLLISEDGVLHEKNLDSAQMLMHSDFQQNGNGGSTDRVVVAVAGVEALPAAQWHLSSYCTHHNRHDTKKLFNDVAEAFEIGSYLQNSKSGAKSVRARL